MLGERVKTVSERVDRVNVSESSPEIIKQYKQVWQFIRDRDGVTLAEIKNHFGWSVGKANTILDGASLYPGSKIYSDERGKKQVYKWDKEE